MLCDVCKLDFDPGDLMVVELGRICEHCNDKRLYFEELFYRDEVKEDLALDKEMDK